MRSRTHRVLLAALLAVIPPTAATASEGIAFALRGLAGAPLSHDESRHLLLGSGADLGVRLGPAEIGAYAQLTTQPKVASSNRQYRVGGQVLFHGEPPATPWGGLGAGYQAGDVAVQGATTRLSGWEINAQFGLDYGTFDGRFAAGPFFQLSLQRSSGTAGSRTDALFFAGVKFTIAALK